VNVVLALVDGPAFHKAADYLRAFPELAVLPRVVLRSASGLPRGRHKALRNLIAQCQPDIVVPVLVHETLRAAAECKARGQKLKLVYPIHENEIWAFDAVADNAAHIDAIVSVNLLMLEALQRLAAWPTSRSFHVRAGVDSPIERRPFKKDPDAITVGYCGKLVNDQKRVGDLIAFCRQMDACSRPYSLWIAGEGGERQTLASALSPQIASGRVRMLGTLSKEVLYQEFYPCLDALIVTSDWETGPLVAWEAMMHGVLVVTSAYRGLATERMLRHKQNALVYPIGKSELGAIALSELFDDPHEFRQIAHQGKMTAQGHLTLDSMVSKWLAVLEKVMATEQAKAERPRHANPRTALMDCVHDLARGLLRRPFFYGNAHGEWPRYKPGAVPSHESRKFARQLDALELALMSPACRAEPEPVFS
jgi:glycosyltransferase involved in cell wall biosynthesis